MSAAQLTPRQGAAFVLRHPANAGKPIRTSARIATWLLMRKFGRSPRTIRWVEGRQLRWYPDSVSVGNAWLCKLLEWNDMLFVSHVVRPGDLFLDVGANVGVYTLLATVCPDVDVIAFEPAQVARQRLHEHIALNNVASRVQVMPFVLSDVTGAVQFTVDRDVVNHVVRGGEGPGDSVDAHTETLPARRLDDLLPDDAFRRSVILKVDAEGHDRQVLLGARRLLTETRPPIIVEWNDAAIRTLLEPLGYHTYSYDPVRRTLTETDWTQSGTSNVIAIADSEAIERRLAQRRGSPPSGTT